MPPIRSEGSGILWLLCVLGWKQFKRFWEAPLETQNINLTTV